MALALFFFCHILLAPFSAGQLDIPIYGPDYDIGVGEESGEFLFENFVPPIQNEKERRFLEGLVVEAGRQVLFPELYVVEKAKETNSDSSSEEEDYVKENKGMKYFEMKGQPEFEESYTNRRSRSGKTKCPELCHLYKPVCGTDGKVYISECHLLRENCGKNNVTIGEWSKCQGNHYLCPSRCLDLNEPVCGSDLRIYHNICIMRKRNCGKLLHKLPLTECYEKFSQSKDKVCPDQCPPISRPACGSNGVIYFNECFLKMRTCREGIVQVEMESCAFVPKCPQVCLPFYDPVCGSDGNLYTNHCRMMQTHCGKEIKKMPISFCSSGPQGSSTLSSRT